MNIDYKEDIGIDIDNNNKIQDIEKKYLTDNKISNVLSNKTLNDVYNMSINLQTSLTDKEKDLNNLKDDIDAIAENYFKELCEQKNKIYLNRIKEIINKDLIQSLNSKNITNSNNEKILNNTLFFNLNGDKSTVPIINSYNNKLNIYDHIDMFSDHNKYTEVLYKLIKEGSFDWMLI